MNARAKYRWRAAAWATLVIASIVLTVWGLYLTLFLFGYPDAFVRAKSGHTLIFLGTVTSAAAAIWARVRGQGWPVAFAVGAPGLLVGLPDLAGSESLLPHIFGLIAISMAFAGLLLGLLSPRPGERPQPGDAPTPPGGTAPAPHGPADT